MCYYMFIPTIPCKILVIHVSPPAYKPTSLVTKHLILIPLFYIIPLLGISMLQLLNSNYYNYLNEATLDWIKHTSLSKYFLLAN